MGWDGMRWDGKMRWYGIRWDGNVFPKAFPLGRKVLANLAN